ncbi:MAG TPA: hypothetical protein VHC19_23970, partial [Pirellulales bacterium]|nr:hypothetical protein [Pirellulales bacterium]
MGSRLSSSIFLPNIFCLSMVQAFKGNGKNMGAKNGEIEGGEEQGSAAGRKKLTDQAGFERGGMLSREPWRPSKHVADVERACLRLRVAPRDA